jgi:hypothetical protein
MIKKNNIWQEVKSINFKERELEEQSNRFTGISLESLEISDSRGLVGGGENE